LLHLLTFILVRFSAEVLQNFPIFENCLPEEFLHSFECSPLLTMMPVDEGSVYEIAKLVYKDKQVVASMSF